MSETSHPLQYVILVQTYGYVNKFIKTDPMRIIRIITGIGKTIFVVFFRFNFNNLQLNRANLIRLVRIKIGGKYGRK